MEHIQPQKDLEQQHIILTEMFPQRRRLRDVRSEMPSFETLQ